MSAVSTTDRYISSDGNYYIPRDKEAWEWIQTYDANHCKTRDLVLSIICIYATGLFSAFYVPDWSLVSLTGVASISYGFREWLDSLSQEKSTLFDRFKSIQSHFTLVDPKHLKQGAHILKIPFQTSPS